MWGIFKLSLMSLCMFLWKYTVYDIMNMVNVLHLSVKQALYTSSTGKLSSFHFPLKNEELNKKWIRFVNRSDWIPTKYSVLCELHFEDTYKNKGKCMSWNWSMKPVRTTHSAELTDTPSVLPTTQSISWKHFFPVTKFFVFSMLGLIIFASKMWDIWSYL